MKSFAAMAHAATISGRSDWSISLMSTVNQRSSWPAEPSELVSPHVAAAGWALQLPLAENLNTTLLVRLRAFN
uniref:HDC03563 n=1 Tax=Drosophila melanogaster TaxID=7227 RepID=Q6IH23_DROME|nr:TPA_inf: HDC03563 [Drosophila melanogaster]